jgi:hypothetical protein
LFVDLLFRFIFLNFLCQVLVEVGIALGQSSSRVRFEAVTVIEELGRRLHSDALCANLSSLVVVLFPLLEPSTGAATAGASLTELTLATNDLYQHARWTGHREFEARPSRRGVNKLGFSDDLVLLCAACFCGQLSQGWVSRARNKAVDVIRSLFLTRREEVQRAVRSVACIPDVEELRSVSAIHAQELSSLTLDQSVRLLCQMMMHDSQQVRALALTRLGVLCGQHRNQLFLPFISRNAFEVNDANSSSLVTFLLQELLQLSARETDQSVLAACARCLGEVGAVDPGRVTLKLVTRSSATDQQQLLPWNMTSAAHVITFGLHLVEHHLLPGLRSASITGAQDRSGFAIQQVLRRLGQLTASGPSDSDAMPDQLRAQLSARGLLEATEAFWLTEYQMKNKFLVRSPPIYFPGVSFSRWISIWTRFLIKKSGGQLQQLFEGCRGIVRERGDLCQFLLPHLVVSILCTHADNDEAVTLGIVQEICVVLRDSREGALSLEEGRLFQTVTPQQSGSREANEHQLQYNHMCVQSVFVLLDTLRSWMSVSIAGRSKVTVGTTSDTAPMSMTNVHAALQRLFDKIPTDLLCTAALSIKAYTRALRYLEVSTREQHRLDAQTEKKATDAAVSGPVMRIVKPFRDRTGGVLPTLSEPQLDSLMTIFAQLEDSDGLEGTQVLRQVLGTQSTAWSRIIALEHSDDWLGTLREYGLMHNSPRFARSVDQHVAGRRLEAGGLGIASSDRTTNGGQVARPSVVSSTATAEENNCMALVEMEELEKGRLRCLLELGHLEAVIDQVPFSFVM